jgi:hypothetical protein
MRPHPRAAAEFQASILLFPANYRARSQCRFDQDPFFHYFTHLRFRNDPCVDNIRYND